MSEPIDFVVTWVDDNDPKWREQKTAFETSLSRDDMYKNSNARYREMGLLKYWFRGIDKFAPWVNRIHFVTCGHVPKWLNIAHPKLNIVAHRDYMQSKYLPTFNSNAIELGLYKIQGLCENFVYFNDDMYITAPVKREYFFRGLPCDIYEVKAIVSFFNSDSIDYIRLNDIGIINRHFGNRASKTKSFFKKVNLIYPPKTNIRNLYNLAWNFYIGLSDPHLPVSYRKTDFKKVWDCEYKALSDTCSHKFRPPYDFSHWIFRYWRLVEGNFIPSNIYKDSKYFLLEDESSEPINAIINQRYKIICLNDSATTKNFNLIRGKLQSAFNSILPEKCSFEL